MIKSYLLALNGLDRNKFETQQEPNMTIYDKKTMDEYQKHLMLGSWG